MSPSAFWMRISTSRTISLRSSRNAQLVTFNRRISRSASTMKPAKRAASPASSGSRSPKRARADDPSGYHLTPMVKNEEGEDVWPVSKGKMEAARAFIRECASANKQTLIIPDKDADGLTSGTILHRTLTLLGLSPSLISTYHLPKGTTIDASSRTSIASYTPSYIFILDQGSRSGPTLLDIPHRAMVLDHHHALEHEHPEGALFVNACDYPPIATTSLLTYLICRELHPQVQEDCGWLCAIGTHGDLGNSFRWEPPFPDMKATFKKHTAKAIKDAIGLLNAPRRTAAYNVSAAWTALQAATSPKELLTNKALLNAKAEVAAEVERCTHTAPKFSSDGRIAVFRISSPAQVHPVIATRWAGHLKSTKLQVVLVANEGYLPGMVNFSCRIAKCARGNDPPVNIIEILKEVAENAEDKTLRERLGESFARGHREASGGIVPVGEFEELMAIMEVGVHARGTASVKKGPPAQRNNLLNYFKKE